MFNAIGYMLKPRSKTNAITVNYQLTFDELPNGDYKFQKKVGSYILEHEFSLSNATMTVQNVTPTHISFIIQNPTEKEYVYGEGYELYVRKNHSWENVEPIIENGGFNDIGFMLAPHSQTDVMMVDWQWLFGELPVGNYRFQKEMLVVHSPGDVDTYVLETYFSLSNITMTIHDVTPNNISLTFENPTENEYIYNSVFALYVYKNDSWEYVNPVDGYWHDRNGSVLAPHSKRNETVDLQKAFGELPDGNYKFQKRTYPRNPYLDTYILEQYFSLP
jgi:hypothetical protein